MKQVKISVYNGVALSETGKVYAWGTPKPMRLPTEVAGPLHGHTISTMDSSDTNVMAATQNKVFVWNHNATPSLLIDLSAKKEVVQQISCGNKWNMILTEETITK